MHTRIYLAIFLVIVNSILANSSYKIIPISNVNNLIVEENPMFPTIVAIPNWVPHNKRIDPKANFYLYWTQHRGHKVYIRWAESIENMNKDTWKKHHQPVLDVTNDSKRSTWDHIGASSIYIDHKLKIFCMFFHGQNSTSSQQGEVHSNFLATSPWGLNFNDPETGGGYQGDRGDGLPYGIVESDYKNSQKIDDSAEFGPMYTRVFKQGSYLYAVGKRGRIFRAYDDPSTVLNEALSAHTIGQQWEELPMPTELPKRPKDSHLHYDDFVKTPLSLFVGSEEFALHPNNPHPGQVITNRFYKDGKRKGPGAGWANHVGISLLEPGKLEIFFYIKAKFKLNGKSPFRDIYRVVLDISNSDWTKWQLLRDSNKRVIFETVLRPSKLTDELALGDTDILVHNDKKYLFYSYGPEGYIGAVQLVKL